MVQKAAADDNCVYDTIVTSEALTGSSYIMLAYAPTVQKAAADDDCVYDVVATSDAQMELSLKNACMCTNGLESRHR